MNMFKIAVIGGGPAGFMAAIAAKNENTHSDITVYDKNQPLKTILCTGGGRCNLSFAEFDFKELASYYPRGEKFLYSVFSKFGVGETLDFFEQLGLETYIQDDGRIFPVSNDAKEVREKLLAKAKELKIKDLSNSQVKKIDKNGHFKVHTENSQETYDRIIIATGGRFKDLYSGFDLAIRLGHTVTELKPALSGLITQENWVKSIAGVTLNNIKGSVYYNNKCEKVLYGDLLFTHEGITGPLAYKISSYFAFYNYNKNTPLLVKLDLSGLNEDELEDRIINSLDSNPKKAIGNIVSEYIPRSLAGKILELAGIEYDKKAAYISKNERKSIIKYLTGLELHIIGAASSGEIVTAGGISLDEVNSSTMESKLVDGLYFCGEVLNIDGLTGGFNLQACWSTGFIAGKSSVL